MSEAADSVIFDDVRQTVISTLGLDIPAARLTADSPLLGVLPELDSMGVVLLLTALEDRFDIVLSDDEIDSAWFETLGTLTLAIESRLPH
ncbi:acyl carrier protein [Halothiobacillus sp.]|uniref:acyl carrier protein n=1 Tax=Halothiobacillus sp. TaxID=1891311 RepID=UPI001999116A|nr:acyl carrier protein [Halothiobacillus sp.]